MDQRQPLIHGVWQSKPCYFYDSNVQPGRDPKTINAGEIEVATCPYFDRLAEISKAVGATKEQLLQSSCYCGIKTDIPTVDSPQLSTEHDQTPVIMPDCFCKRLEIVLKSAIRDVQFLVEAKEKARFLNEVMMTDNGKKLSIVLQQPAVLDNISGIISELDSVLSGVTLIGIWVGLFPDLKQNEGELFFPEEKTMDPVKSLLTEVEKISNECGQRPQ